MQVEFCGILAGIAAGTRQPDHHALIQLGAFAIPQATERCPSRHGDTPTQRREDPTAVRPAYAHYREGGLASPGSDREDGVRVHAFLCLADTQGAQRPRSANMAAQENLLRHETSPYLL